MEAQIPENEACDITFLGKVRFYSTDYLKCFLYLSQFESPHNIFTKSFFSKLITCSHLLEDFLDFHGAKNNSKWYFYRELAAAVRHLSLGGYSQRHISNRLVFYDIDSKEEFRKQGDFVLEFMTRSLMKLAPVIIEEARRLEIQMPDTAYGAEDFPGVTTSQVLDYDFADEEKDLQQKHLVWVANEFLSIAEDFDSYEFYDVYNKDEIKTLVPSRVNE